jgi:hypothetical protein
MSDFVPPPPKDLIEAFIGEIDQNIEEMDGTIAQLTQMLAAAKARLHGLLCSKSVLEDKLEEWADLDSDTASAQPEQLELPLELPDNVVPFTHGSN